MTYSNDPGNTAPPPQTPPPHQAPPPREPERGGNAWLALLVGGLLVAVAVIAWLVMSDRAPEAPAIPDDVNVDVNLPEVPEAPDIPDVPAPNPEPPTAPSPAAAE